MIRINVEPELEHWCVVRVGAGWKRVTSQVDAVKLAAEWALNALEQTSDDVNVAISRSVIPA